MKSSVVYFLISLTGMVFGAEIVASHVTQSLVLLISAYHMLYNLLSLLLLIISHRMSKGKTLKNTFGWARVKVVGCLINMLFLTALCLAAIVEAIQTTVHAAHEDTEPRYPVLMVILGLVNFALNALCFVLIGGYTHHQGCAMILQDDEIHMNCVVSEQTDKDLQTDKCSTNAWNNASKWYGHQILDILRDISTCMTVISCGAVILLMNGLILKYADAFLSLASIVVLLTTTYPFIRESGLILLQSIPSHMDVDGLTKRLVAEFPDLVNVHDLHVWRLTASEVIATVHIILSSSDVYARIENGLNQFFLKEGISSATIQPEFTNETTPEKAKSECILQCSVNNNCGALTCCGHLAEKPKQTARCRIQPPPSCNNPDAIKMQPPSQLTILGLDQTPVPKYDFATIDTATETRV